MGESLPSTLPTATTMRVCWVGGLWLCACVVDVIITVAAAVVVAATAVIVTAAAIVAAAAAALGIAIIIC